MLQSVSLDFQPFPCGAGNSLRHVLQHGEAEREFSVTSKALLKMSDLKRMAVVAKREHVTVEYEVDGVVVRVKPYEAPRPENASSELPDDFAL